MRRLEGQPVAAQSRVDLGARVSRLGQLGVTPTLAIMLVGNDPAAEAYVRGIERASERVKVACKIHRLSDSCSHDQAADTLTRLSADDRTQGILLPTPLPAHLEATALGACVPVAKDVDGVNPESAGRLWMGLSCHVPATALAVMALLSFYEVPLEGVRAVVIGRSAIVGKPVAALLLAAHATVTICHSRTRDLADVARQGDVLVVAVGRPHLVGAEFVKEGAVVVDVGINEVDGVIVGDVDGEAVTKVAGGLAPVPGGVGPLTALALLRNVVTAAETLSEADATSSPVADQDRAGGSS